MRGRCFLAGVPWLRSMLWALTVLRRSSTKRTGHATRAASSCAKPLASAVEAVSCPDRATGRPTTTSRASYSATRGGNSAKASSRCRVRTGTARTPSGSVRATPTRTVPTSTPIRTPRRITVLPADSARARERPRARHPPGRHPGPSGACRRLLRPSRQRPV